MATAQRNLEPAHLTDSDRSYGRQWMVRTETTISAGDLVVPDGMSGPYLRVVLADTDAAATSRNLVFVARHAVVGTAAAPRLLRVSDILVATMDTTGSSVGAPVYVSSTAGGLTLTEPATGGVIVGRVVRVGSATTGRVALCPTPAVTGGGGAGSSGTDSLVFTINQDGAAASDEDPVLRLEGGTGAALRHGNLTQDSSAAIWSLGIQAVGAAFVTPEMAVGRQGETTASLDSIFAWNSANDAAAARKASATYLGQEHLLQFSSATAALALDLIGTGGWQVKAASGDANAAMRLNASSLAFGAGGAGALDVSLSRSAADTLQLAAGDSFQVADGTVTVTDDDANNASVSRVLSLVHTTSGVAAAGIGTGLLFRSEDDGGTTEDVASIYAILTNTGAATEASAIDFNVRTGGAALAAVWRINATGQLVAQNGAKDVDLGGGDALQLDEAQFTDAGANATAAGRIRRNAAVLTWHDGTAARQVIGGDADLTANGVVYGTAAARAVSLGAATNGQLVIGSTGAAPVLASLTAPAAGITITGGAGTVTFALANDLAAFEALDATAGYLVKTGADAYARRTLTGTANQVAITNGDGTVGNPTFSTPQDIHTAAAPQFARLGLGAAADAAFLWAIAGSGSVGLVGSNAGALTLTIDAQNAGAGTGNLVLTADENVQIGDAGNPTVTFSGSGTIIFSAARTIDLADNQAAAWSVGSTGMTDLLVLNTTNSAETVEIGGNATVRNVAGATAKRVGGIASASTAASTAITGTTEVETNFDTNYTLPANSVRVGSILHLHGFGVHTATTGAETHDMLLKWGGVTLSSVTGIDPGDNEIFMWDMWLTVRTIGAGAGGSTVTGSGDFHSGARATAGGAATGKVIATGAAGATTAAVQTDANQVLACAIDRQAGATDSDSARLDQFICQIWY
ncbi:MAG: hypothetical protein QME96_08240 [Myxococcota bacterium]|nr:hypothetical protein [Myxococcota bacterium]